MNLLEQWYCFKDKVKMEEALIPMTYGGLEPVDFLGIKCPKCGAAYLSEEVVMVHLREFEESAEPK